MAEPWQWTFPEYNLIIESASPVVKAVVDGDCKASFDDLLKCNGKNEYDYGKKCMKVRRSLLECAVKSKVGELGKSYLA